MAGGRRALLSVFDKTRLVPFARGLVELGFELLATGGTRRHLQEAGLPVTAVESVTGFAGLLGGRVKTLHPHVYAGILAARDDPEHVAVLERHGIAPIDLVCVNFAPFVPAAGPDAAEKDVLEPIDVDGPALVRAAAKNFAHVLVVVRPEDYEPVLQALASPGGPPPELRRRLAQKAFAYTSEYDEMISRWLAASSAPAAHDHEVGFGALDEPAQRGGEAFPETIQLTLRKLKDLRYGENPHQHAAFYAFAEAAAAGGLPTVATAEQLSGKQLSYNNINDADAALRLVMEFGVPAAVAVKHANPCGVGIGPDLATAFERAFRADEISIFGGIVAFNRKVDGATARLLASIFLEIVVAPDFDDEALAVLQAKKALRLLRTGYWPGSEDGVTQVARPKAPGEAAGAGPAAWDYRGVAGGILVQTPDETGLDRSAWRVVTSAPVPEPLWRQVELAWLVCKHVKSNAIVLVKDDMTIGIGAGQMNHIDATRHAIAHAARVRGIADGARGAVMASDAFFPFPDVVEAAGAAGVAVIVQPGGSIRDEASIEAANRFGISMIFTGRRHFRH